MFDWAYAFVLIVAAQPQTLSLQQATQEALLHAPIIHRAHAISEQAGWQKKGAEAPFKPRIDFFAGYTPLYKFGSEATGKRYDEGVVALKSPLSEVGGTLQFSAFDGMQNVHRLRASAWRLRAALDQENWEAFALARNVRYAYRQVQAAQRLQAAATQQLETLQSHRTQVTKLREQQAATDFDILRVEVQVQDATTECLRSDDNVALTRRNLARLMGLSNDDRELSDVFEKPEVLSIKRVQAVNTRVQTPRLDLQALQHLNNAQNELRRAAEKFWWPKVEWVGSINSYNNWDRSIHRPYLYNMAYTFGVRVRMNVFDGGAQHAQAQAAEQERRKIDYELSEQHLNQGYALEASQRGYLYACARYKARMSNIDRAQDNIKIAQSGYNNGSRNSTDVLDAQADLFNARAQAIQALLAIEEHAVALELALGQDLSHDD